VGASGDLGFEERLTREILQSERTRMLILAGLSGSLVVVFPVYVLGSGIFGTAWALQVVAVLVLLASYELAIRQVVGRRLEQGKTLPRRLRFLNAFVETSVPSILILLGSRQVDPVYPLESAAAYLYPVFIVLSTLRLDFRLSVFTGCVAAVEYVILSFVLVGGSEVAAGTLFSLPPFHLAKGVMLVLAGLAAGFVADQIKRRVMRVFLALEERQRIVNAFGQQVSPAIVEELLKQGPEIPSKRTFVCVLFMDIRDFTRLVEKKTPEEFVAYQNAVFGAAIEIVDRNHGVINQFLGDGFMATFGAPVATGRDCRNALSTARELLAAVKALRGDAPWRGYTARSPRSCGRRGRRWPRCRRSWPATRPRDFRRRHWPTGPISFWSARGSRAKTSSSARAAPGSRGSACTCRSACRACPPSRPR
jgi:adenylate cyclase